MHAGNAGKWTVETWKRIIGPIRIEKIGKWNIIVTSDDGTEKTGSRENRAAAFDAAAGFGQAHE